MQQPANPDVDPVGRGQLLAMPMGDLIVATDEDAEVVAVVPGLPVRPGHPGSGMGDAQTVEGGEAVPTLTLVAALDAVVAHLRRFVHLATPEHADAVALWTAHTHAYLERLGQSPILALTSAVKQSGKTRVLDVIEFLVRAPWRITRPSESVLFRKIDADHPTVLLDEVDAIFGDKTGNTEGIRSLFNSGNRRGTKVPRTVAQGRTFALVEFDVFCPKATAGIGGLPDTILDRVTARPPAF